MTYNVFSGTLNPTHSPCRPTNSVKALKDCHSDILYNIWLHCVELNSLFIRDVMFPSLLDTVGWVTEYLPILCYSSPKQKKRGRKNWGELENSWDADGCWYVRSSVCVSYIAQVCVIYCTGVFMLLAAEARCDGSTWNETQVNHYEHW